MKLRRRDVAKVDGRRLNAARIAANMSVDEVAAALGCNKSSVSRWELGLLNPTKARAAKMAELFGTAEFLVE